MLLVNLSIIDRCLKILYQSIPWEPLQLSGAKTTQNQIYRPLILGFINIFTKANTHAHINV